MEIEFAALSLASPENVTFRYQLEGLDQEWIDAGTARIARYPRMPPGEYRFRVIACNHDGIWNENGASLAFMVVAPFYRTWWFQILAAVALLGTVGGIVRYVESRKMRRQVERAEREGAIERERARIAKDIHDDLGASLTEITLLSELAQSGEAPPGEVQADMRKIAARTRQLTQSLDATVWAVNPRNDTLDSLVSYLCQHAEDFLKPAGIRCRLDVPARLPGQVVTAAVRHNVFLIVKEALHNVVRHSGATEVSLRIALRDHELILMIEDNGRGFDPSAPPGTHGTSGSHGNGLSNMNRRAEEIEGRLDLRSQPGSGTRIVLEVRFAGE
jgi:signal transduction histidine kinase